jgi:hypothetical protein
MVIIFNNLTTSVKDVFKIVIIALHILIVLHVVMGIIFKEQIV